MSEKQTLPGWLYKADGSSRLVQNDEEKAAAEKDGFTTHERAYPKGQTPAPARRDPVDALPIQPAIQTGAPLDGRTGEFRTVEGLGAGPADPPRAVPTDQPFHPPPGPVPIQPPIQTGTSQDGQTGELRTADIHTRRLPPERTIIPEPQRVTPPAPPTDHKKIKP